MKRHEQKGKKRRRVIERLWTYDQARQALPYIRSVVASIREHRLEALAQLARAQRLAGLPGRPDRTALLAQADAADEARRADERFQSAVLELQGLDVFCLDPLRGEALIPFVHDNQLAWFVFDLFDEEPLQFWRYHSDPIDSRRPMSEVPDERQIA